MDHGIGKLESGYNIVKPEEKVKTEEIKTEDSYQADSAINTLQTGFDGNKQKFAVKSGGNTEKLLPCTEEVVESRERGIEDGKGIQAVSTDKPQCSLYDARSNKGRNRIPANHIQSGDQDGSDGPNSMSAKSIGDEDQSMERRDGEAILVSSGGYDHKEASAEDVMQLLHSIEGSLGPVMDSFRKFSTNTLRASTCCQTYKTLAKTFNKKISGVKELLFTAQSIVSQMKQPRESEPGSSEKDTNKDTEFKSASLKDKLQEESKNIPSCDLKMKSADQQDDSEPKCQSASADMPCSSLKNVGDGVDGLPDTGQHIDVYPRSGVDAKALVSLCNTLKEDLQNKDAVKGLQSMIEKTDVGDAGEIRNSKEGDVVDEIIVEALSHDVVAIQETKSPASLVSEKPSDGASGGFQDKSIGRDKYSQTQTQTEEVKKGPNLCQSFRRRDLPADISGDLEGRKLPFDECSNLEVRIKNFDSHEAANIKAKNRHSKPLHPLPSKDQAALSEDKKSLTNEDTSYIDIHSTSGTNTYVIKLIVSLTHMIPIKVVPQLKMDPLHQCKT
ncbi:uncharacterized protein [Ptychodera flava]|uniref:uncharacterized protein n=1 Tax=Ptychodera flava TaxID=63121 RepID=UPI003969E41E